MGKSFGQVFCLASLETARRGIVKAPVPVSGMVGRIFGMRSEGGES
ncbi:hypothetical protein [uncultured Cohaesibacter sp.]